MNTSDEFILALREAGFTDEVMQKIIKSRNNRIAKKMLNAIKYDLGASKLILDFTVDYTCELFEGIIDDGGTHRFLPKDETKSSKKITTEVFNFTNDEDIEKEMAKEGCRPANAYELVIFGQNNPKLLRPFPILALGSTWPDHLGDKVLFLRDNDPNNEHEYCYFIMPQWPMTLPESYYLLGVHM
ncbi:MAG: hypothetical protein WAW11_04170 [Patescibacteria group bacterium]